MKTYFIFAYLAICLAFIPINQAQWYGGWPQLSWGYNSQGIGVDQFGNTFGGTPQNGIYLLCNGHGCPGRG